MTTTFDLASRPVSDSAGNTYVSNKEGRILAMPGKTLVWDNLGRLTQVNAAPSGTLLATYTYDALDRLRTITESATTIRFRYVGLTNTVAQVINDSPATLASGHATDFAGNELFDFTSGGATQTYLGRNDHGDDPAHSCNGCVFFMGRLKGYQRRSHRPSSVIRAVVRPKSSSFPEAVRSATAPTR